MNLIRFELREASNMLHRRYVPFPFENSSRIELLLHRPTYVGRQGALGTAQPSQRSRGPAAERALPRRPSRRSLKELRSPLQTAFRQCARGVEGRGDGEDVRRVIREG